jgi:uncharacterized protein YndB with AHSA1/START domain
VNETACEFTSESSICKIKLEERSYMEKQTVNHSTFVIEREFPVAAERVFSAFSDPARKRRWFVEGEGFEVDIFELDFRVGGKESSRFRSGIDSPLKGASLSNDTWYLDIVPNKRIVLAYTMAVADQRISASLSTFEFLSSDAGTRLVFTEQAAFFENSDGPVMREQGWRELLERLANELSQ